ncbi:MAG: GntR family transcriptional regulator [Anaerolineales bacterium]|nr:GntR family transcriptional regulator [Anaerolineales bacterium]
MKNSDQSDTLVDQVYEQILDFLYYRGLSGIEVLSVGNLAEKFGVSRTPITMALVRLESEGLIKRSSAKGWATVPLTLADITEIFDLKDLLEPMVAKKAAENITPQAAEELESIMNLMEAASEARNLENWLSADHRYHDLLFRIANNQRLWKFQEELNKHLYRLWIGYSSMEGHMAISCVEHREVGEAVVAGDPELAEARALYHSQSLRKSLIDVVENVLIPFLGQEL